MNPQTVDKIRAERSRQTEKWGAGQFATMRTERTLAVPGTREAGGEEVGELAQAILEWKSDPPSLVPRGVPAGARRIEEELIQVAAVAARWLDECFSDESPTP